jgi:uncharacterized protein (DUF488 family)
MSHRENRKIYTIGYGGRRAADLLRQLSSMGIEFLIDVRSSPNSRYQPDFSRAAMENWLPANGIKYVFMGEQLGGLPKDNDCYTNGKVDYSKYRQKKSFQNGINRLKVAYSQGLKICLLCSEAKPWECHRSKLIASVLGDEGLEVEHFLSDGSLCTQSDAMLELTGGQENLFGQHLTSRKVYR